MKIYARCFRATAAFLALSTAPALHAANYYYNDAANPGWFAANAWSLTAPGDTPVYDQTWDNTAANNHVAHLTGPVQNFTVQLGGSSIEFGSGGIYRDGAWETLRLEGTAGSVLNFNGGTIRAGATNGQVTQVQGATKVQGTATVTLGNLIFNSTAAAEGTFTVDSSGTEINHAQLTFNTAASGSSNTNLIIRRGIVNAGFNGPLALNLGAVTFDGASLGAELLIGGINQTSASSVTVTALSGSLGRINLRATTTTNLTSSLIVNQNSDTTFVGGISKAASGDHRLALTKSGSGTLRLAGAYIMELAGGATVNGGTLLVNAGGGARRFYNTLSGTAITVANGGTFGGTANLDIQNGSHVIVADGGILTPGDGFNAAGRTTFTFSGGDANVRSLDLSGVTTATGWLKFDLGADTTAGTTYDQIRITDGVLNIGTGLLNFNDFSFNLLTGFEEGTYRLFELTGEASLQGTLGASLSGLIGSEYIGTIGLDAFNNVYLNVEAVPEPSSVALLLVAAGTVGVGLARRRR